MTEKNKPAETPKATTPPPTPPVEGSDVKEVFGGEITGVEFDDEGNAQLAEGADAETARAQLRLAQKLVKQAQMKLNTAAARQQGEASVTPTGKRTAKMDADPTVVWTGSHYQKIV